jgi:hypothetical protein
VTDDLVAFLRARLDEDEETARKAQAAAPPRTSGGWPHEAEILHGAAGMGVPDAVIGCYLAHGDPQRVLDEVDGKRRGIKRYEDQKLLYDAHLGGILTKYIIQELYDNLRLLALPYRGHPEYRSEWAPEAS